MAKKMTLRQLDNNLAELVMTCNSVLDDEDGYCDMADKVMAATVRENAIRARYSIFKEEVKRFNF